MPKKIEREIKFRLSYEGKIVGYEKAYSLGCVFVWLYSKDGNEWSQTPISHDHKDQFTDRYDKNRKEIYEGDRVRCKFYNSMWLETEEIVEFDPLTGYNLKTGMAGYDHEWEVIENPELLEKSK